MSDPLAIGAVTAVLKSLLTDSKSKSQVNDAITTFDVSTKPPDQLATENKDLINLFMFRAVENPTLRNSHLATRNQAGERVQNAPLAVDLKYLVTTYGSKDFYADILMGYAMHVFHESPVLTRNKIRSALSPTAPPTDWLTEFENSGLADQFEQIKITPHSANAEELSRLWAAFQTPYRPTAMYTLTVVLIEAAHHSRHPLPVLTIGEKNRGVTAQSSLEPPFPALTGLVCPNGQISIRLGETLTLLGHHLAGTNITVRLEHRLLKEALTVTKALNDRENKLTFELPDNAPADWPAGLYRVSVSLQRGGESQLRTTNELPLALSPTITPPVSVSRDPANDDLIVFNVNCTPEVWKEQRASLAVATTEIALEDSLFATIRKSGALQFEYETLEGGDYLIRLRVDGVDSVLVDRFATPPEFNSNSKVTVPAKSGGP